jgi:hypothetical protein
VCSVIQVPGCRFEAMKRIVIGHIANFQRRVEGFSADGEKIAHMLLGAG